MSGLHYVLSFDNFHDFSMLAFSILILCNSYLSEQVIIIRTAGGKRKRKKFSIEDCNPMDEVPLQSFPSLESGIEWE